MQASRELIAERYGVHLKSPPHNTTQPQSPLPAAVDASPPAQGADDQGQHQKQLTVPGASSPLDSPAHPDADDDHQQHQQDQQDHLHITQDEPGGSLQDTPTPQAEVSYRSETMPDAAAPPELAKRPTAAQLEASAQQQAAHSLHEEPRLQTDASASPVIMHSPEPAAAAAGGPVEAQTTGLPVPNQAGAARSSPAAPSPGNLSTPSVHQISARSPSPAAEDPGLLGQMLGQYTSPTPEPELPLAHAPSQAQPVETAERTTASDPPQQRPGHASGAVPVVAPQSNSTAVPHQAPPQSSKAGAHPAPSALTPHPVGLLLGQSPLSPLPPPVLSPSRRDRALSTPGAVPGLPLPSSSSQLPSSAAQGKGASAPLGQPAHSPLLPPVPSPTSSVATLRDSCDTAQQAPLQREDAQQAPEEAVVVVTTGPAVGASGQAEDGSGRNAGSVGEVGGVTAGPSSEVGGVTAGPTSEAGGVIAGPVGEVEDVTASASKPAGPDNGKALGLRTAWWNNLL